MPLVETFLDGLCYDLDIERTLYHPTTKIHCKVNPKIADSNNIQQSYIRSYEAGGRWPFIDSLISKIV